MKQNDKSKEENDIIKCEYNLYYLLNNFIQLEKSLFDENEIKSAEKILNELHFSLSKLEIDDEYLSKISVEYLLEYLRRFPEDSRENNFEKICNELENDLNKLIKEIDFEILSNIFGNLKCNKRFQRNDKQYLEILDEYELNNNEK